MRTLPLANFVILLPISYGRVNIRSFTSQNASCLSQELVIKMTAYLIDGLFYGNANFNSYFLSTLTGITFLCNFVMYIELLFHYDS